MSFFIKFFISLFLLFIFWVFIVYLQSGNSTKMSQWVYDAYEKKSKIAQSIDEKKIIIVAGSNALFGINSKMLNDAFEIPVVNFGVNAGVLLPYTLYKSKEVISDGDIVLMPLEYPMYNYDGIPNEQMIDYIYSRDMDMFFHLSLKEQFYMIWNITFKRLYDGYMALGGQKIKIGLYGSHHIDNYGDQIQTNHKHKTKGMFQKLDNLKSNHYGANFNHGAISWDYLKEFVDWCKQKNVQVVFMPSTLMYFKNYKEDEKEAWFYKNIGDKIKDMGWIYVGNPYEYMYDKSLYFNTDFHLIDKARDMRTKQMILDLKLSNELKSF